MTDLKALGFSEEVDVDGEAHLELAEGRAPLKRNVELLEKAREEVSNAAKLSSTHGLPYRVTLELPNIRRACAGDEQLGTDVPKLLLSNDEFRDHVNGCAAEMSLPSITQLLRSKRGIQGLLEFYMGAPPAEGTRVARVSTVSEWKDALLASGERPVCAMFSASADVGCRIFTPMYLRIPDMPEADLSGVDFLQVVFEQEKDDGLAAMIFDEAYVSRGAVPSFLFFSECLEIKKWRYQGADVVELVRRLSRIAANDRLDEGPGGDE